MALRRGLGSGAVLLAGLLWGDAALASGPPPAPRFVTARPHDGGERALLARGRIGIVKAAASDALLYLDWRVLNGLAVGQVAADALTGDCCDVQEGDETLVWVEARRRVVGIMPNDALDVVTDRPGPDYTTIPTCFRDAFATAAATLADRARRFGARSPAVRAWLATQDAVFRTCGRSGVILPPLPAAAPTWLRADYAYQTAAAALYDGRFQDAARRFDAIAHDAASPWRPTGAYLTARALLHAALAEPGTASTAAARGAIDRLARATGGAYGQAEAAPMRQRLDYREHPAVLLRRLDHDLGQAIPGPDLLVAFRDYMSLSERSAAMPPAADWIRTVGRADGLAHALDRWTATGRVVWLVAALGLANAGDAAAPALVAAADRVLPGDPAWPTAQYHILRLTIGRAPASATRTRADHVLAMPWLTRSDRNVFTAIRAQSASDPDDFVRHVLRSPYCDADEARCVYGVSPVGDALLVKASMGSFLGMGADARAIIDRLPSALRISLAGDAALPRAFRLDIALTSYARGVALQDERAIDRLATMLATLLPQMGTDWRRIAATPPGADRRFAEFFAMAKLPGLRVDLADYQRPEGSVAQFGGSWIDWQSPRGGASVTASTAFAPASAYLPGAAWDGGRADPGHEDADLTCLDACGRGRFPLHLPAFARAGLATAQAERRFFVDARTQQAPDRMASLWDETLDYVASHPRDPRAPETLYRLIRVARWGGNHRHLGRRAFRLLHGRYPASVWARRSPLYYDD